MRVSGPFEILSKRSLLRYTGHSRQHALRVMMVMPVMDVQQAHLYFRVDFRHREVNSTPSTSRIFRTLANRNLIIDAPRCLSYSSAVRHPPYKETLRCSPFAASCLPLPSYSL